ncbi:hypothetical protein PRUB_a3339 [Pseudoalteromonas rubra]|uniref:Uncharacterized protein n=1 Tax=Pseudoalteromonas rubra TaxID=43658 RepID=A0A8T0C2U2_9GAMM|nr:hypothetical protein PRUB_a3339 [Pseudoalteromonas rubra]
MPAMINSAKPSMNQFPNLRLALDSSALIGCIGSNATSQKRPASQMKGMATKTSILLLRKHT